MGYVWPFFLAYSCLFCYLDSSRHVLRQSKWLYLIRSQLVISHYHLLHHSPSASSISFKIPLILTLIEVYVKNTEMADRNNFHVFITLRTITPLHSRYASWLKFWGIWLWMEDFEPLNLLHTLGIWKKCRFLRMWSLQPRIFSSFKRKTTSRISVIKVCHGKRTPFECSARCVAATSLPWLGNGRRDIRALVHPNICSLEC